MLRLALPATATASKSQEAMLQDDDKFIYATPGKRKKALDEAVALGVDRLRVTVLWAAIAPKPKSRKRPKFDATRATIAGMISAAPTPSSTDQPMISTVRFGASAVVPEPSA